MNGEQFVPLWQMIQAHHRHDALTDSTNTQLIQAVMHNRCDHSKLHLFTADYQNAGRGQHGRSWVSGDGNVFLSLYVPMQAWSSGGFGIDRLTGLISLLVGVYLAKMPIIEKINQMRMATKLPMVGVKWANDLGYYDDNQHLFKKLAGILIEPVFDRDKKHALKGLVIGVGLNVQNTPVILDGLYQAISLSALWHLNLGRLPSLDELYYPICKSICQAIEYHNRLTANDNDALKAFISDFNGLHLLTNRYVQVFARDDMVQPDHCGRCIGIDGDGALLLEATDGIKRIFAGMIQLEKSNQNSKD